MKLNTYRFGPGSYEFLTLTETAEYLTIDGFYDLICGEGATHRLAISGFRAEKYEVEDGEMFEVYQGTTAERRVAQMVEFAIEDANYYDPCQPHSDVEGECPDGCGDSYHTREFSYPPK